jgi:predicted DNA-binding helix-hairpin-helix protein
MISAPPHKRENRLYQADWLMRFYHFRYEEIVDEQFPFLDPDLDPKLVWALRHPEVFPIDLNRADYEMILRIPGVGVHSARLILQARRFGAVRTEHLRRMGVALKRAKYFIHDSNQPRSMQIMYPEQIRRALLPNQSHAQLSLFAEPVVPLLRSLAS